MTSDVMLNSHWEVFLSHLCEFYPLDKSFIEQYEYELDWNSISKNKTIDWTTDFLSQYESRFSWHELAWNDSILWTEERIDIFKKRLDWYYLGRNKNLPITEDFIKKYAKKLFVVENNPRLTSDVIAKFGIKVIPANSYDSQELKELDREALVKALDSFKFYHNQKVVFDVFVAPIVEALGLERIFQRKFDYSQRYYYFLPVQEDVYGLTPEFEIDGSNPFEVYVEGRGLLQINDVMTLRNGSLQEGPDRLYEVPRFRSFSYYSTLLVSEHVRSVLEDFRLPPHKYHPVILKPKKITTATQFFILQVEHDILNKDLEYGNNRFHYSFRDFDSWGRGPVTQDINNYDDLLKVTSDLKNIYSPNGYGVKVRPEVFVLKSDYDLYSYSVHGNLIVNQYLKDALEKAFPGQILFKSAQLLNIRMDQDKYDAKASLSINTKRSSKTSFNQSDDDKYYFGKMERLEKEEFRLKKEMTREDKFSKKELELNVLFPDIFKENYLGKRIRVRGYRLLPISKFYIQNDYAGRYPESYKSVVIAENGLGDSINLMLKRDSDYELQHRLFEFFHETGEYEEC